MVLMSVYIYLSSNRRQLLCGVLQGSILGPLLFLIYINDLRVVCKNVMPLMFADDSCLLLSHSNIATLIREVNEELQNISNGLKLINFLLIYKKIIILWFFFSMLHAMGCLPLSLDWIIWMHLLLKFPEHVLIWQSFSVRGFNNLLYSVTLCLHHS